MNAPFKIRKRVWKYVQACKAFDDAETMATLLLRVEQSTENLVEAPFWTALVVSYGRPFTHNQGVGPIDVNLVPPKHMKLHTMLIAFRNKVSGHIDHTVKFDAGQDINSAHIRWVDGEIVASTSVSRPHAEILPAVIELCQLMKTAAKNEWRSMYEKVPGAEVVFTDRKTISLRDDSDAVFK